MVSSGLLKVCLIFTWGNLWFSLESEWFKFVLGLVSGLFKVSLDCCSYTFRACFAVIVISAYCIEMVSRFFRVGLGFVAGLA